MLLYQVCTWNLRGKHCKEKWTQNGQEQGRARARVCLLLPLGLQISWCEYLQEKLHTLAWGAERVQDSQMLVEKVGAQRLPQELHSTWCPAWPWEHTEHGYGCTSPCTWHTFPLVTSVRVEAFRARNAEKRSPCCTELTRHKCSRLRKRVSVPLNNANNVALFKAEAIHKMHW